MGTRILVTNHPSMNDLSMRLILMSFCYHSEVIHMGHQKGAMVMIMNRFFVTDRQRRRRNWGF